MTTVSAAIAGRISTRAFLSTPVPEADLLAILEAAQRSPSGGNLQPWKVHLVIGAARDRLVEEVNRQIADDPFADESEFSVYPAKLWEPYRTRRYQVGEDMYALLGIPREDKMARLNHLARNYSLFGAPAALFFSLDRRMGPGQWAHLGMYMQTLALLFEEAGLATCMQEAWAARAKTVSTFLNLSTDDQLYCGMAVGYADKNAPVNQLRAARAEQGEVVTVLRD
ncbi:MAG: nitroreductase [Pseudomonadota bacterium]